MLIKQYALLNSFSPCMIRQVSDQRLTQICRYVPGSAVTVIPATASPKSLSPIPKALIELFCRLRALLATLSARRGIGANTYYQKVLVLH